MENGKRCRDVYLTAGRWRDMVDPAVVHDGPLWLRDLAAPLSKLPCFVRETCAVDFDELEAHTHTLDY